MTLLPSELFSTSLRMKKEMNQGNSWLAYDLFPTPSIEERMLYFKSKDEAWEYCVNNSSDSDLLVAAAINPLLSSITAIINGQQIGTCIGAYYFIDDVPVEEKEVVQEPGQNRFSKMLEKELMETILSSLKHMIMKSENVEYLINTLRMTGFGEELNKALVDNMQKMPPEFTLHHQDEFNGKKMSYDLQFKLGDKQDMYFFNNYAARMESDAGEKQQTFYMNNNRIVTAKEAFNLLDGRAVYKELINKTKEKYDTWLKMDFENKTENGNYKLTYIHENFGYKIEKAIDKLNLQGLENPEKREQLLKSLEKGNLQAVTDQNGERIYIAAEPESGKSQKVQMYDKEFQMITTEVRNMAPKNQQQAGSSEAPKNELTSDKTVHSEGNSIQTNQEKQTTKQAKPTDENQQVDDLTDKNSKKKGMGKARAADDELLPKKRNQDKQGLKI
ncbi:MAG: hypothetical protein ABI480_10540 [Chitinophagaceae bacterium]